MVRPAAQGASHPVQTEGGDLTRLRGLWRTSSLGDLPDTTRETLLAGARRVTVPPGTVIYRPYDPAKVILVERGQARVVATSADGRSATIRIGGPGHFFGLISLFGGGRGVAAEALTELHFWELRTDQFERSIHLDPELAFRLARDMAQTTDETIELVSVNIFGSVRQRVARQLLDLAEDVEGRLVVRTGQQDIANGIGSVREVVARAVRTLKSDGLISRTAHGIEIVDPVELHRVASGAV